MAAAMAEAAALKVAPCTFGTGDATGCPKYESYCCHWPLAVPNAVAVRKRGGKLVAIRLRNDESPRGGESMVPLTGGIPIAGGTANRIW